MNLPRKPIDPLPPRDGELARVRRRALARRLRVPGSAAAAAALAVFAYTAIGGAPRAADRVEITEDTSPSPTPAGTLSGSPSPSGSLSPSTAPSPSHSPRPSLAEEGWTPSPEPSPTAAAVAREITGVVQNDAFRPMGGVLVHAEPADGWGDGGLNVRLVARTDAQGRWRLPCGTRRVVLSSFEFYRAASTSPGAYGYAVVAAPPCGGSVTTRLGQGGAVEGRLVDAEGQPVRESRSIGLMCPEDPSTSCLQLRTDAEGRYAFHGLHAGSYAVVTDDGKARTVTVRPGTATTYDPVVEPAASPTPTPTQ